MQTRKQKPETSGLARGEEKETLLTNLRSVQFGDINLHCHALLLSEGAIGLTLPSYTVRGFGTEAAWEVFHMHFGPDAFPYMLEPFENKMYQLLRDNGRTEPLFSGNILTLANGTKFELYSANNTRPLDIHVQQHGDICRVWEILAEKTREYWDAPYMPSLSYAPAKIRARNFI